MSIQSSSGSSGNRTSLTKRLSELQDFISTKGNGSTHKGAPHSVSLGELSLALFTRASFQFLERKSLAELAHIAQTAQDSIEQFTSSNASLLVIPLNTSEVTSFLFILKDCPFIVSSTVEAIRTTGFEITAFLHPIVSSKNELLSLNYIELGKLSENATQKAQDVLTEVLEDVALMNRAHPTMSKEVVHLVGTLKDPLYKTTYSLSDNQDIHELLEWLQLDTFIFAGICTWNIKNNKVDSIPTNPQGLFGTHASYLEQLVTDTHDDIRRFTEINEPVWITKLSIDCPVHRRVRLCHFQFPILDLKGKITSVTSIIGIFSSKAIAVEASSIPLVKRKMNKLLENAQALGGSHDYKFIVDIIDRMPKEEAIRLNASALQDIIEQTIDVYNRNDTRLTVRYDASKRGALVLVVMPRERLNEDTRVKLQHHIERFFDAPLDSSEYHLDLSAHMVARFYFHVVLPPLWVIDTSVKILESDIRALSQTWEENLHSQIKNSTLWRDKQSILNRYRSAFPKEYQALCGIDVATSDIEAIESLSDKRPIRVILGQPTDMPGGFARLDVFRLASDMTLSQMIPVLEHAGFEIVSETSAEVTPTDLGTIFIHRFTVKPRMMVPVKKDRYHECLGPGLEEIFLGNADDDVLCSLMLTANLNIRCVVLLRTYCSLLWQLNVFPRKHQIREAFAENPTAALKFWELFEYKFNPTRKWSIDERISNFASSKRDYEDILHEENDIIKDKTLRALLTLVDHTKRTNFFTNPEAIAIKIHSEVIDFVPQPRPLYEIFVHSKEIEGTHLRRGPVSRGGLRWSERQDDFRTEVLGLVKTQQVKNVFIVPQGAKGGFIVRNMPKNQSEISEAVRKTYQLFIRTMLSIADNRIGDAIQTPDKVIAYDGYDPYFVVAADKGTATFSDIANQIACDEFGFWLDDAFASGGSNGYDHKQYAITARGAWECVIRHFNDLSIDYLNQSFSAVGIGDMAGDVFGNGMLLSEKMKLISAFNHKHIFIDPTPDCASSFKERKRLFDTPRTQWSDYSKNLISKGGGVFERVSKEIDITPEIRKALGISPETASILSGEELITHILKAPVDLLWNGGIGTYVKATTETTAEVNDSSNDRVRINAKELRCRIVGEGGNLGFTQRARIEFASLGGKINSDAIDNSGGVGLSDNEVNIKIFFSGLLKRGDITREQRNAILKEMALDVCDSVLQQNRDHAYRLSSSSKRSVLQQEHFKGFLNFMHRLGFVNRTLDCLPDDDELYRRQTIKQGLYRPELAVCLAASKMWIKSVILESNLIKSPLLEKLLLEYFPPLLRNKYKGDLIKHPLAANIIATQATNAVVDYLGISFIYRLSINGNVEPIVAIRAALAAIILCDAKVINLDLRLVDTPSNNKAFIKAKETFEQGLRDLTTWLTANHKDSISLDELVTSYQADCTAVFSSVSGDTSIAEMLKSLGLSALTLSTLKALPAVSYALESSWVAKQLKIDFASAWSVYESVKQSLALGSLTKLGERVSPQNKWEYSLVNSAMSEIKHGVAIITMKIMKRPRFNVQLVEEYMRESPSYIPLITAINEIQNLSVGVAHLAILARQLREFVM